jgi:serine/threonine-protein kinase
LLRVARFPQDDVIRIAKGIARGLVAAHGKGIVHRDLKPENVMLDAESEPKILDFGLAKLRASPETLREILEHPAFQHQPTDALSTEEGRMLGTPAYMSPEQAAGRPVDARSDLFSLGVVLYEALTGGRPFVGETSFETLASVMRDAPRPLREANPEVPPRLAAIVMKCLAKAPAERHASADELLDALERLVPPARRSRALLLGGVGIGLFASAVLFVKVHDFGAPVAVAAVSVASSTPFIATAPPSTSPTSVALVASTSSGPTARKPMQSAVPARSVTVAPLASKRPARDPLDDQN